MHLIFSATCGQSKRLLLQSLLQLSATNTGQRGPITATLAGCSDEEKIQVLQEPRFYYDFRVHFTPDYSTNDEAEGMDSYLAFNKPFGMRHFLHNAFSSVKHDILALIDIDFYFFRPLEINTGRNVTQYYTGNRDATTVNDTVANGLAISQDWTTILGSQFYAPDQHDKLEKVCDSPHQPYLDVSEDDAREYYTATGPPFIMTRHDFLRMVDDYCDFCVQAHNASEKWEVEMFAYSMAAVNHGIRHKRLSNLGITHPKSDDGGHQYWGIIDEAANPCEDPLQIAKPAYELPVALHHCELYFHGSLEGKNYLYWKHKVPGDILDCSSPVLALPPAEQWSVIEALVDPNERCRKKQEVWADCSLIKSVNQAVRDIKSMMCPAGYNSFMGTELV